MSFKPFQGFFLFILLKKRDLKGFYLNILDITQNLVVSNSIKIRKDLKKMLQKYNK